MAFPTTGANMAENYMETGQKRVQQVEALIANMNREHRERLPDLPVAAIVGLAILPTMQMPVPIDESAIACSVMIPAHCG